MTIRKKTDEENQAVSNRPNRGTFRSPLTRLTSAFPNLVPVHGPVHASWLNQIEIYFSIVQRKALTPNDFSCLAEVEERLLRFQDYFEAMATPFDWRFTRANLARMSDRLSESFAPMPLAA